MGGKKKVARAEEIIKMNGGIGDGRCQEILPSLDWKISILNWLINHRQLVSFEFHKTRKDRNIR